MLARYSGINDADGSSTTDTYQDARGGARASSFPVPSPGHGIRADMPLAVCQRLVRARPCTAHDDATHKAHQYGQEATDTPKTILKTRSIIELMFPLANSFEVPQVEGMALVAHAQMIDPVVPTK